MRTAEERIRRAAEFKRIWAEFEFDSILAEYRDKLVNDFVQSETHEAKRREDIHRQIQLVGYFQQHIITLLTDGDAAKLELKGRPKNA